MLRIPILISIAGLLYTNAVFAQASYNSGNGGAGVQLQGTATLGHTLVICGITNNYVTAVADSAVGCSPSPALPSAPQNLVAGTTTISTIPVTYTAPATGYPASYTYTTSYSTNSSGPFTNASGCVATSALSCNISGLLSNTTYYVDVTATNTTGTGPAAVVTATTMASAPSGPTMSFNNTTNTQYITLLTR